jgi:hypothetical protein
MHMRDENNRGSMQRDCEGYPSRAEALWKCKSSPVLATRCARISYRENAWAINDKFTACVGWVPARATTKIPRQSTCFWLMTPDMCDDAWASGIFRVEGASWTSMVK